MGSSDSSSDEKEKNKGHHGKKGWKHDHKSFGGHKRNGKRFGKGKRFGSSSSSDSTSSSDDKGKHHGKRSFGRCDKKKNFKKGKGKAMKSGFGPKFMKGFGPKKQTYCYQHVINCL